MTHQWGNLKIMNMFDTNAMSTNKVNLQCEGKEVNILIFPLSNIN